MSTTSASDVRVALDAVPLDDVMTYVSDLVRFDRYQASNGIMSAAELVARAAERAGLSDVEIRTHRAHGGPEWWSFETPVSWTPLSARMDVILDGRQILTVDHADQPFTIGTHSEALPPGTEALPLAVFPPREGSGFPAGAIAVVDTANFHGGAVVSALKAAGASGVVTAAPSKKMEGSRAYRGRIELPPHSGLFAFSLTPDEFHEVTDAALVGARARVVVEVDQSAPMPVVTACIPGTTSQEVWVTAHLCHPRPGANDNASGVAASLGVASALAKKVRDQCPPGPRSTIRFVWAPEFVGVAAVLDASLRSEIGPPLPEYVINLDMVGEDQELCRAPFVVERPPDLIPTLLTPLTEHVVSEVFRATSSHPGTWQRSPFLGFSDHALFADPAFSRPAVQFCHPKDRFNHSAGDDLDKVSPVEMLRSTAAATALCELLAWKGACGPDLAEIIEDWCERELRDARRIAGEHGGAWGQGLVRYVGLRNEQMRVLASGVEPDWDRVTGWGDVRYRRWEGPLNLRAMAASLSPSRRQDLQERIARDKSTLSVLFNLAIRVDGTREPKRIVEEASYALRAPLPQAQGLFELLEESGWVSPSPPDGPMDCG